MTERIIPADASSAVTGPRATDEAQIIDLFFALFMPQLEIVGRYALSLQQRLASRDDKHGDAWTSAVTDADLGVQHYLEAFVLAECPDWHLHGEEHAQSFNTRYLPAASPVRLMLDPINGTRLYRDGADSFDILLSLSIGGRLVATVSYMPARGIFYGAARDRGAFTANAGAHADKRPMTPGNDNMTLAVYRADEWLGRLPRGVVVFDVARAYRADDERCCMNSIFTGALGGYLFGPCALLDVGATAFTAAQAAGIATLPDGRGFDYFDAFEPEREGALLVCTNPALHATVSGALAVSR